MRINSIADSAGFFGKKDLTTAQTRTWYVPLTGRRQVAVVLKSDASAGGGFSGVTFQSQAHGDCDLVTITPVDPQTAQTFNAGGIGATHAAALSDAVIKANGYVITFRPMGVAQSATAPVAITPGYPASRIKIVATVAGGGSVTGSELIVYEEPDLQASG